MSTFQTIVTIIFGLAIIGAVLFFAIGNSSSSNQVVNITIWGTVKKAIIEDWISLLSQQEQNKIKVTYTQFPESSFDQTLVESIASGNGPDVIFLNQDQIVKQQNKIIPIPFTAFSERDFKSTFVQEGELFLTPQGIVGIPIIIDPLVMYWNRTSFTNANISKPPQSWDEVIKDVPLLTIKGQGQNIVKSGIALGAFSNISYAKDIFSLLLNQAGNPIMRRGTDGLVPLLDERFDYAVAPTQAALNFFIEFSNPVKNLYSWNTALPLSRNMFVAGDLAMYFGYASELQSIRDQNPNLNFDVADFPQSKESSTKVTFGKVAALSILKSSKNPSASYTTIQYLASANSLKALSSISGLPPVRRDLLSEKPADPYQVVFYTGAIRANAWLDPDRDETQSIFKSMIESVVSGRSGPSEAINKAQEQLRNLVKTQ